MQPNLERIPGYDDARAEVIVRRAQDGVTAELMNTLERRDVLALGRYGSRQPSIALRTGSPEILRAALLATGIAEVRDGGDPRDLMIGLALDHVVASSWACHHRLSSTTSRRDCRTGPLRICSESSVLAGTSP